MVDEEGLLLTRMQRWMLTKGSWTELAGSARPCPLFLDLKNFETHFDLMLD
jgi:hypothetical protein